MYLHYRDSVTDIWRLSRRPGWSHWYKELMTIWKACNNSPYWEGNLVSLLSRLAEENLGQIDWEPEMTRMFQKFLYSLQLPVYYKKLAVGLKPATITTSSITRWIIYTITPSSSSLDHLEILMNAINSYYHPTSEGRYSEKLVDLLSRLIHTFCSRLHKERYEVEQSNKPSWVPKYDSKYNLTDDQIDKFCTIFSNQALKRTI